MDNDGRSPCPESRPHESRDLLQKCHGFGVQIRQSLGEQLQFFVGNWRRAGRFVNRSDRVSGVPDDRIEFVSIERKEKVVARTANRAAGMPKAGVDYSKAMQRRGRANAVHIKGVAPNNDEVPHATLQGEMLRERKVG